MATRGVKGNVQVAETCRSAAQGAPCRHGGRISDLLAVSIGSQSRTRRALGRRAGRQVVNGSCSIRLGRRQDDQPDLAGHLSHLRISTRQSAGAYPDANDRAPLPVVADTS